MTKLNTGNGESLVCGVVRNNDGTFTALTYTCSQTFKTQRGATAWLARKGFDTNGNRLHK